MESVIRFFKRNIDNFIMIIISLPGCWWCANSGSYNQALTRTFGGYISMCVFFVILLGVVLVFSAFSFKAKRTLASYIVMTTVAVLLIVPIVMFFYLNSTDTHNTMWENGKLSMFVQFIVLEVIALAGCVAAFFRIDYTKRDLD